VIQRGSCAHPSLADLRLGRPTFLGTRATILQGLIGRRHDLFRVGTIDDAKPAPSFLPR
jgi:hypothetical protein